MYGRRLLTMDLIGKRHSSLRILIHDRPLCPPCIVQCQLVLQQMKLVLQHHLCRLRLCNCRLRNGDVRDMVCGGNRRRLSARYAW